MWSYSEWDAGEASEKQSQMAVGSAQWAVDCCTNKASFQVTAGTPMLLTGRMPVLRNDGRGGVVVGRLALLEPAVMLHSAEGGSEAVGQFLEVTAQPKQ